MYFGFDEKLIERAFRLGCSVLVGISSSESRAPFPRCIVDLDSSAPHLWGFPQEIGSKSRKGGILCWEGGFSPLDESNKQKRGRG